MSLQKILGLYMMIVNGKPGNLLDPKGTAARAEAAAVLMRYIETAE